MKICKLCGLDDQCCFHNKNDFNKIIANITKSCSSKDGSSKCNCAQPKKEAQRLRYQEILNNLPSEVKIQMPQISALSDIYREFITKNPSFK